jgi:hypothetical protein
MSLNSLLAAPSRVKVKSFTALLSLIVLITVVLTACGGTTQSNATTSKHILKVATQSYDFAQSGHDCWYADHGRVAHAPTSNETRCA